jgi:hypothetical protein
VKTYFLSGCVEGCLPAPPLDDAGVTVSPHGATALAAGHAVASVLVIEAETLEQAVALAQGHPALTFGAEIDVRPVKAVPPPG